MIEKGSPLNKASKALILLHGRGGTADDIVSLSDYFCDESFYIVAPNAKGGSWYPYSFMAENASNEPWLQQSVNEIKQIIDKTAAELTTSNIFIMGFSQGACLSLEISTRYAARYAGVIAFTGGLIGKEIDNHKYHGNFEGTNVFIGTSDRDPHVPLKRAQASKDLMEKMGAKVILKVYPGMAHTINEDEIHFVKEHFFSIRYLK